MPSIIVNLAGIDRETKKILAHELTRTASEVLGMKEEVFQLYINEHGRENVAVGGVLLADK